VASLTQATVQALPAKCKLHILFPFNLAWHHQDILLTPCCGLPSFGNAMMVQLQSDGPLGLLYEREIKVGIDESSKNFALRVHFS
jgi:hypothetical protein